VERIDYYAGYQPWKPPKWLFAAIAAVFTVTAIGAAAIIVKLTAKAPEPPKPPAAAALAAAAPAQRDDASETDGPAPAKSTAAPLRAHRHAAKHLAKGKRAAARHGKGAKVARAASTAAFDARAQKIMSKHRDNAKNRKDMDALDKLLN
jgi:hypothetical protein